MARSRPIANLQVSHISTRDVNSCICMRRVIHKHVSVMKYRGDIKTFYLNIMNYGCRNVFPFKGNAEYFGVCCRSPFVMRTIKRVFSWQWKFMVALLCPNNSHIVSRTDSPCRKQQACYQSHIFAYCETALPPSLCCHTKTLETCEAAFVLFPPFSINKLTWDWRSIWSTYL